MRKIYLGVAVFAIFAATTAVAVANIVGGVPSANTRSGSPADILATGYSRTVLATGTEALENPSGIITRYGYLSDSAGQASGLETKTEPDQNTYLTLTHNPGGPDRGYNYGHHFLFQGHEVFSSAVAGVGHSNSAYITRINLDVPVGDSHRITLQSTADASGNTGMASLDGSAYNPFTSSMIFTGEGNNPFGGVFSTSVKWAGGVKPGITQYLGSIGTGGFEGVQFDNRGNLYLAEDAGGINVTDGATATKLKQPNSFIFRFKPSTPGVLSSGKLQALRVKVDGTPITFHSTGTGPRDDALGEPILRLHSGQSLDADWVTVHDTAVNGTATFNANTLAKAAGATPLKRPENLRFVPGRAFHSFVFTETGDTDQRAGTYPGGAERGAWGSLIRIDMRKAGADTAKVKTIVVGDGTRASFDSLTFLTKNLLLVGEDRGETLHTQLNALDSAWSFNISKSIGTINADSQRLIALGRDAASSADVAKKENVPPIADQNDGDNEVTGLLVANGSSTASGAPGALDPESPGFRIFVTRQHGENSTYELFPGGPGS
jgi:hypothetical protein